MHLSQYSGFSSAFVLRSAEEAFWTSGRWMKWTTRARRGCIPPRFASLSQGSNVWSANGGRCHDSSQGPWGKPCLSPTSTFLYQSACSSPASARPGNLQGKTLSDVFRCLPKQQCHTCLSSTLHLPYILLTTFWACSGSSGCLSKNSAIGFMLESKYPGSRYPLIRRKCCWSILVPLRWASPTTRNFGQPPCISSCIHWFLFTNIKNWIWKLC